MPKDRSKEERKSDATLALVGLSLGDALGQQFLRQTGPPGQNLAHRCLPPGPWPYSDDTEMGLAVLEVLEERGTLDQELLAKTFACRFQADPERGYGAVAYALLHRLGQGMPWREVSRLPYGGQGSMGNGAAMRVAPLGAWFAEDIQKVIQQARASAEVTHAHPEGQAGAIAVAVAAAYAWAWRAHPTERSTEGLLPYVVEHTPEGETRRGLREAAELLEASPEEASKHLGDGEKILASGTVPFALWCAARHLGRFEEALWTALSGLLAPVADRDTVCAIVGGVTALASGWEALPPHWLEAREPLSSRLFLEIPPPGERGY